MSRSLSFLLRRSPAAFSLAALTLGLGLGALAAGSPGSFWTRGIDLLQPLGSLWINAIRMTLIPLVCSLLIGAVTSFSDLRQLGSIGGRAVAWFVALLVGVALISALIGAPLMQRLQIPPETAAELRHNAAMQALPEPVTLRGFIVGLVPLNPIRAAADGAILPLIVFTILFGVALTRIDEKRRGDLIGLARGVAEAMLLLVRWILRLAPIGVFALALGFGRELGGSAFGAIGYYASLMVALHLIAIAMLYLVVALSKRVPLSAFARACAPAQAVAAGTRSSLASLPAMLDGTARVFGDRPAMSGLVLPLAVSIFKLDTPISELIGPLFIAQLYGVHVSGLQIGVMVAMASLMSFGKPGIPSGGFLTIAAPLMLGAGIPLEGLALLIAADAIPDLFSTVLNVSADMTVGVMLMGEERRG